MTANPGEGVVTEPASVHSLGELRDAITAATNNENKRNSRVREIDRFGSHLKDIVTDLSKITSEHVGDWWTGMRKFSEASGQDRLKELIAVFEIAKQLGWTTVNPAQVFRDAQNADREEATVAPTPSTPHEEEEPKPVPSLQVEAPLPDGPATADPARAEFDAAEAKKRTRVATPLRINS